MFQDGRLCCTFDVRCAAVADDSSRGVTAAQPLSSQALLHSAVTDTSASDTTTPVTQFLICVYVRFYRIIFRISTYFCLHCEIRFALPCKNGGLETIIVFQYLFVRVSGSARVYNVTDKRSCQKHFYFSKYVNNNNLVITTWKYLSSESAGLYQCTYLVLALGRNSLAYIWSLIYQNVQFF